MINIYSLEKEGIPFYVGKTKDPLYSRFSKHKRNYSYDITISLIDQVEDNEWKYWECYWIEQFKHWGFTLLNKNNGGGGPKFVTQEVKDKLSKPRKIGSGNNISKGKLGKRKAGKIILQLDFQDNIIKEWKDAIEVCLTLNKSRYSGNIGNCCLGRQKSAYGYKWKYK